MRIFSKVTLLCNICFLVSVWLCFVQNTHKVYNNSNDIILSQPVEGTIVIMGYGAILVNFVFTSMVSYYYLTKTMHKVSRFIIFLNFLFLILEIYYFFFFNET